MPKFVSCVKLNSASKTGNEFQQDLDSFLDDFKKFPVGAKMILTIVEMPQEEFDALPAVE